MVFSLFYWNINSSDPNKKFILLKSDTENELAKLQMRTGNSTDTSNDVNPERLSMYRAIEVFLPKD
jgi:hypothetical protein